MPPSSLRFKEPSDSVKYDSLDFRIRFFVRVACHWSQSKLSPLVTVTDINTPGVHMEGSAHYDLRAIDLRLGGLGINQWEEFGQWINDCFDYGKGLKIVLVGRLDPKGGHNDHVHIQVPGPYQKEGRIKLWALSPISSNSSGG